MEPQHPVCARPHSTQPEIARVHSLSLSGRPAKQDGLIGQGLKKGIRLSGPVSSKGLFGVQGWNPRMIRTSYY